MKKFEKLEKFALTGKQATQVVGGEWIYIYTPEGRGAFNDKNGNGRLDPGESWWYLKYPTTQPV